ncbi:TPA: hypothetical protein PP042_002616, partial [Salmonella bongori]|nr:hypothetical protein [Salmonella bongori]
RKLALEVFTDWINKHSPVNLDELRSKLSEDLQKRAVALVDQIPEKSKNRYHMQEDALIELPSGERIAISNQWGLGNIELLIDFVRRDNFVVEKMG